MSNRIIYPKEYPFRVWKKGEKVTLAKVKDFFDLDKNRISKRVTTTLFYLDLDDVYSSEFPALEVGSRFNDYLEKRLKISLDNKYSTPEHVDIYSDIEGIYLNHGIQGVMRNIKLEVELDGVDYPAFRVNYVRNRPESDYEVALRIAARLRDVQQKASAKEAAEKRAETIRKKRKETYLKLKKEFEGE